MFRCGDNSLESTPAWRTTWRATVSATPSPLTFAVSMMVMVVMVVMMMMIHDDGVMMTTCPAWSFYLATI